MVLVWGRKVFGCLRDTEQGMPLRDCQYRSGAGGGSNEPVTSMLQVGEGWHCKHTKSLRVRPHRGWEGWAGRGRKPFSQRGKRSYRQELKCVEGPQDQVPYMPQLICSQQSNEIDIILTLSWELRLRKVKQLVQSHTQ